MRILGSVVATVLVSSLGTLMACSSESHDKQESIPTSQAVSAASVQIDILDKNGAKIGSASGVMIAPQLVLTAAHNLAGQASWKVTSADGKQIATSARAMTYDWMSYESNLAHPRRHDVGVIHLDQQIKLDAYPAIVTDKATDNVSATRVRGINGTFVKSAVTLNKVVSSPNNWLAASVPGETLDTGGAVFNDKGILGIVSGQGLTTGKLYIARVDQLGSWLDAKVACAGGSEGVRTYVAPVVDKSVSDCDAGGASSGTVSTGGSGSGSNTGASTSPSGSNSGSGNGGTCSNNNDGHCSGTACGNGGTNGTSPGDDDDDNGGSNGNSAGTGANGSGSGSANGNGGTNGTSPNGDDDDDNGGSNGNSAGTGANGSGNGSANGNGGTNGTSPNGNNGGTNGNTAGSANGSGSNGSGAGNVAGNGGTNGTSANGGENGNVSGSANGSGSNGSGNGNAAGSVGGAGSNPNGGDNGEACQGSNDNSDICPPEPVGCSGPTCGGGAPDESIDYGNCACSSNGGNNIVIK